MSNDTDRESDLIEQASEPGTGAITSDPTPRPGAPKLPPGVTSAWELNRRDPSARSYYSPDADTWQPDAHALDDPERERERATAERLGFGFVQRMIENMVKRANGPASPEGQAVGVLRGWWSRR